MKKHKIFALIAGIMLLSGCADSPEGVSSSMTFTTEPTTAPAYPEGDDVAISAERTNEEITIIKCGDNYFTYSVNMHGVWFLDETEIILPDDYEQPIGTAAKLIADTKSSSGGFSGGSVCHIKNVKQQTLLGFDDEWTSALPVWDSAAVASLGTDWDHLSEYGYDNNNIAVVYKSAEDGGVYTIGNTADELVVCCNGVDIGRYDTCRILPDPKGRTFKRIILCENDIDEQAVWQLIENGTRSSDSYFWIGDAII